ncbi:tetratricopeptide repeat protein [Luteimonas sp. WGS1318]|uniref:tetratricopeptide repeat protein n=1 Tax=Luteimonas sp. WGS1318 TaxID=3366815 RepID=UPI00372D10CC
MPLRVLACACVLALAACASQTPAPSSATPPATSATPQEMVALIRGAAGDGDGELAVQPLRDPMVDDLRERANALEAQGDLDGAVAALDQALEIVDGDPALLQERAELAVLQADFERAGTLAERGYALGSQLGPLCRRHWITLEQVRLMAGDVDGATSARTQADGCRVAGPERY